MKKRRWLAVTVGKIEVDKAIADFKKSAEMILD